MNRTSLIKKHIEVVQGKKKKDKNTQVPHKDSYTLFGI